MFKTCPDCGLAKDADQFHKNAARPDGRAFYCRDCATLRKRESTDRARLPLGGAASLPRRVLPPGNNWCPDYGLARPFADFGLNTANGDGRTAYCRSHHNERVKATRAKNHGSARRFNLMRRYGIGEADVDAMAERQNGMCAAWDRNAAKHVDHDHETGKIRGLLCFTCNVALGNAGDSIETLQALIGCLRKHREEAGQAAEAEKSITVSIPTHRDFSFTIRTRVTVIDRGRATLVDSRVTWPDSVTYETYLAPVKT